MITKTFVEEQAKQLAEKIKIALQTLSQDAIQKMIASAFLESVSHTEQACDALKIRTSTAESAREKAVADLEATNNQLTILRDTLRQVRDLVVKTEVVKAA